LVSPQWCRHRHGCVGIWRPGFPACADFAVSIGATLNGWPRALF